MIDARPASLQDIASCVGGYDPAALPVAAAQAFIAKLVPRVETTFLPKALSAGELEDLVRAAIQETGATSKAQMGLVMKAAQAKAAGRADGKAISTLVNSMLPS